MDTDRHRIVFLDWLRFAACFLVMLIHACECIYSNDYSFAFPTETDRWSIACISGFARPAVPLFLMASAYLLVPVRQDLLGFFRRRRTGTLARLAMGGVVALEDLASELPAGPRLTCARAFTDNDKWIATGNPWANDRSRSFFGSGLSQLRYYGRGPHENYVDRKTSAFVGIWESTVSDQFVPYVRPQDCGMKCDVRWAEFTDASGRGVRFSSAEPMFLQALHYDWEDLWFASFKNGEDRYRAPLRPRKEICLNLDARQTGLGGASCGPNPMWKYRFDPAKTVEWTYRISAVGGKSL